MNTRSIDMHLYKCISISVFNKGGRLSNYLANQLRCVLIEHSHEKTNNAYAKTKTQSNCTADQRLCFRHTNCPIPLLLISKVSSF